MSTGTDGGRLFGWKAAAREQRQAAAHEAGHALVAECLGWPVYLIRFTTPAPGSWPAGLIDARCYWRGPPPSPLADAITSAAGHAAELAGWGRLAGVSAGDRDQLRRAFRRAGARVGAAGVRRAEERLAGAMLTAPGLPGAVRRVADALLGPDGELTRREFLAAAGPRLRSARWRRAVRELAEAAVMGVYLGAIHGKG